ncbi:MAG: adenosine deaminase [Patescibacteria group bacterium]|nr:adenosine deaminase [Patescibacteria group bacterium]MDD5715280.1 adenosine deaminase [Patescibacteria group bacterium]
MPPKTSIARAELHAHLGSSVHPAILWSIAHRQGIRLPTKNYWDFEDMITMSGSERNKTLDDMHNKYFYWTELIQSSPEAIEESVTSVLGGGYRKCNIVLQELRFNPMFRNRGGERDLDHIIVAALWGLDRAMFEYPQVRAGIILMMDRMFTYKQNAIILEKAIRYRASGIVGIDLAGPQRKSFSIQKHTPLFRKARKAGLGVTVHAGEEGNIPELRYVVRTIQPDRIGHGFLCVQDPALMRDIVKRKITLELCPTSNLRNSVIRDKSELKRIIQTILRNKIRFTINTDGPEMYDTNIFEEQEILRREKILSQRDINRCTRWAFDATFID